MKFLSKYLSIYSWHSINIIPQLGCIAMVTDDPPYTRDGSMLELVVLGTVIHAYIPINLPSMGTRLVGPVWSRKRKEWW